MARIYALGSFRLDVEAQVLFKGTEPVALGQRAVVLLSVLLERRGELVSKDALIEAAWPGLAVEESNLTVQIAALRRALAEESGAERWVETLPRRGYRFVGPVATEDGQARPATTLTKGSPALPDRPSIAVLPFQNLSGDPEQEYFADGMVEDIIMALSRMRWLFVIARNSSFTYKGRAVDIKQVGRELGVRYILEGSVRKAGSRVRIAGQLINATTGTHLWADRFEGEFRDIFDLQDQVTSSVVGAMAPKLEQAEIDRAKHKPTDSLDAYDNFLRGMASFHLRSTEANDDALRLFSKAIELDTDFAATYGSAAWCYVWRKLNGWMIDRVQETAEAIRLARRSLELGKDDAIALSRGAHALGFLIGDLDTAVAAMDRALLLNPNLAVSWYLSGWLRAFNGEPDIAIEHEARAMRLSPLDPFFYNMQAGTGFGHMLAGRYDEASLWAERALRDQPKFVPPVRIAAASHALAGRIAEAQKFMARVRELDPTLRVTNLKDLYPFRRPEDFARWKDGLQKAGLPE